MGYNTEKQLQEHSSKIPDNIKDQVRGDISSLNEAVVAEDSEKITEALERLKNSRTVTLRRTSQRKKRRKKNKPKRLKRKKRVKKARRKRMMKRNEQLYLES